VKTPGTFKWGSVGPIGQDNPYALMKATRLAVFCLFVFALVRPAAFAAERAHIKVQASRALSLAVVDLARGGEAGEQLADAFKESLSFEMSQRCKEPTPIKPARVDGPRAGWGLGTGLYDVAVVIGGNVPKTMVSSEFTIYKAVPTSGDPKRTISLITRKADPGLAQLLADSFPDVIQNEFFLKALMRYSGAPSGADTEWKVAGVGN
jgi:hypothetical protein